MSATPELTAAKVTVKGLTMTYGTQVVMHHLARA